MKQSSLGTCDRIAFLHPDLGLGGAERLVVDAAVGIQKYHEVFMFTTHHEKNRCFKETIDGTLKHGVSVYGDWIPRTIFGNRGHILFSTLRMLYAACIMCFISIWTPFTVLFIDQVSAVIPVFKIWFQLLHWMTFGKRKKPMILFYCHFPDQLLSIHNQDKASKIIISKRYQDTSTCDQQNSHSQEQGGEKGEKGYSLHQEEGETKKQGISSQRSGSFFTITITRIYRLIFNWIEEKTTAMSDVIFVNSNYTREIFKVTFPSIKSTPIILYPSINCELYDKEPDQHPSNTQSTIPAETAASGARLNFKQKKLEAIVSINRFERKKGIDLAVNSFAKLKELISKERFSNLVLILAGGYDPRIKENKEYFDELKQLVKHHGIEDQTIFLPSFNDMERYILLHDSTVLVYTPENEHFGIVPIEAQYCRRCVVAVNSGGPLESIEHNKTGILVNPNEDEFAMAIATFLNMSQQERVQFGERARQRVLDHFSLQSFTNQLNRVITTKTKQD